MRSSSFIRVAASPCKITGGSRPFSTRSILAVRSVAATRWDRVVAGNNTDARTSAATAHTPTFRNLSSVMANSSNYIERRYSRGAAAVLSTHSFVKLFQLYCEYRFQQEQGL